MICVIRAAKLVLLTFAISLPLVSPANDKCSTILGTRATIKGIVVDSVKLYSFEKALGWRLLTSDKSGRDYFDRIIGLHQRGQISQGRIENVLLQNWHTFSGDAIDDMILWFAQFGNIESVRRIEREITTSTNKYVTNTQRYLFESLLEIALRRGREAMSVETKSILETVEGFWMRGYLTAARERAIHHPEIYSQADGDTRERLFRSFDYREQRDSLTKVLDTAQRHGFKALQRYLYSSVYGFGEHARIGSHNSPFYGFNDFIMEIGFDPNKDPTQKWQNPYNRFLFHTLDFRVAADRSRPERNVYVDIVSITLNWLAVHKEIWTDQEFKREFIELLVEIGPKALEVVKALRPELYPVLTLKTEGELVDLLERASDLKPDLFFVGDLLAP